MIPAQCRIPHRPDEGKYGDCLRAAVASILEVDTECVPHFAHDNPTGEVLFDRLREHLWARRLAPFISGYSEPLEAVLAQMGELHPDIYYMLFGSTGEGDHVVVCKGGEIVHNPSWYANSIVGPASVGFYQIVVFVRL